MPESLPAATGLQKAGHATRYVMGLWAAVAIFTMLADTMMPEAFEHGGAEVGLLTVLGFALASWLSTVG